MQKHLAADDYLAGQLFLNVLTSLALPSTVLLNQNQTIQFYTPDIPSVH